MVDIKPMTAEYEAYLRDESRSTGDAQSISFPRDEQEIREVLASLAAASERVPVTVQGARTGLAAGAVPAGGHIMNLSRANGYLGLRRDDAGTYYLRMQPGVILSELRRHLANKTLPTDGWDRESLTVLKRMYDGPEQFFATDPTEISAWPPATPPARAATATVRCART